MSVTVADLGRRNSACATELSLRDSDSNDRNPGTDHRLDDLNLGSH